MFRTTVRRYCAVFRAQGAPAWRPTDQTVGGTLRRRNITAVSQTPARLFHSRIAKNLPVRPTIANSLPKARGFPSRIPRRSFHQSSKRFNSNATKPKRTTASQEPQGLSARLKKLSREYGWAAAGVYLGLSVIDFPFCFLLVRVVGTERIGEFEHFIVSNVQKAIPQSIQDRWHEYRTALKEAGIENVGHDEISEYVERVGWGVEEAEARHNAEASLGTQLALAYAIHKSFIFVRVPLAAAITPKVVKVLRSWGWNIGKRSSKNVKK